MKYSLPLQRKWFVFLQTLPEDEQYFCFQRPMSDCDGLQNKLGMSPCNKENDVPQNSTDEWSENIENFEQVHENGVDVIVSSDSDEDTENLAAQGYISLAQSEDDIAANEIEQVCDLALKYKTPFN